MYDEDIEKRVQQYLDEIESVMKQPYSEKAEVLQNIEAHIHDALITTLTLIPTCSFTSCSPGF